MHTRAWGKGSGLFPQMKKEGGPFKTQRGNGDFIPRREVGFLLRGGG